LSVTVGVLFSACPYVLGRYSKQTILSPSEREEEEVRWFAQSSAYTERPNLPLVKEETPFLKHVNV
jgi:hypothetical protein